MHRIGFTSPSFDCGHGRYRSDGGVIVVASVWGFDIVDWDWGWDWGIELMEWEDSTWGIVYDSEDMGNFDLENRHRRIQGSTGGEGRRGKAVE